MNNQFPNTTYSVPDSVLVARFANGDDRAFTTLFNRHIDNVVQFITSLYGNCESAILPDDIASEAFMKVAEAIRSGRYAVSGKFAAYLTRTARNLFVDYTRRAKNAPIPQNRFTSAESDDLKIFEIFCVTPAPPDNLDYIIAKSKLIDLIKDVVDKLPDFQRSVISDRLSGRKFIDIASRYQISQNTALGRHKDGIDKIRRIISQNPVAQCFIQTLVDD